MFAVFPGPIGAPEAFDELLATARRLAERLTAIPQDERGNPLGAQRALAIREELVHFQGLVDKTRQRQSG
jgi:FtsZ-interacting cell division protein ZipA